MKIEWAHQAIADLNAIQAYIALDSPLYAEDFVGRIIQSTEKLLVFPKIGRRIPEAGHRDDIREIIFRPYRIIYYLLPDLIEIVTVVHSRHDLAGAPEKPWDIH